MKIRLYGYDVEIRASNPEFYNEYNEQDSILVLSLLVADKCTLWQKAKKEGNVELAKLHEKDLRDLSKALDGDSPLLDEVEPSDYKRPRAEVMLDIKGWFLSHMEMFNKALEDLDDYNGYLGKDRVFPMCELSDHLEGLSAMDVLDSVSAGFDTKDMFFKWCGTCYCSQNTKDYSEYVTEKTINAMANVKERLCIVNNVEIRKLFEELEGMQGVKK